MNSESLRLSPAMVGLLGRHNITTPTPIQIEIIPAIFEGQDVIAQSETGSGKTLSFAIPLIERISRRDGLKALVIVPTRELAIQIAAEFIKFSQCNRLEVTPVYGGVSLGEQIRKMDRTNIVVGTPGRLIDLLMRGALHLDTIQYLVIDEVDRMLDMGFSKDIEKIIRYAPRQRQTLLFSATIPAEIVSLSRKYLSTPKRVQLPSKVKPKFLSQAYYKTSSDQKLQLLISLLKREKTLALVFCNRKEKTESVARQLSHKGISAQCLNGGMTQRERERVASGFRHKKFTVLVATDVAARGLHIDDITHVYNYDIPRDVESYTHRVGRTARAGNRGNAISLVDNGEDKRFFNQILAANRGIIQVKAVNDHEYSGSVATLRAESTEWKPCSMVQRRRDR
jgi:ATP-dependent RNA helicase DeaD